MDQAARAGSGDAQKKGPFRMGMKGLMIGVACCALIFWAGLAIRDYWGGYQPLRGIRSGDRIERLKAAQDLPNQGGTDADAVLAALIQSLGDEDAGVRAAAAQSLGSLVFHLVRDHPPTVPGDWDRLKRRIEVATRGLVPLLSDRDPGVRAAAATGLGTMAKNPSPGPLAPEQLAALRDESNAVRRQAADKINGFPDEALPPELVAALRDESAEVRAAAARALVRFGPDLDRVVPALIAMMGSDEPNVRRACAEALEAAWPTPALVPTLIGLLKSRDREVRYHAAQLLGRIGPEARAAIPALIAILKEPLGSTYTDPAQAAARALGLMGPRPEAIAALVEVIAPEKVERVLAARHWLVDAVAGRVFLGAHSLRNNAAMRIMFAMQGLSDIGPPAITAVRDLIGAYNLARIRASFRIMSAIQGLGDIGPPAVAAAPAVIAAYDRALEARFIMAETIPAAIGRIAPNSAAAPDAVAVLIRALDSDISSNHLGAVEALGHFGADASAAIPKLRAIREDFDRSKLGAAVRAGRILASPGTSVYTDKSLRDAAAKSVAALEAQSQPDAGGERGRRAGSATRAASTE